MATAVERLQELGPIHPPKVAQSAIKPSIARSVRIKVTDPLDHDAPAILHEPKSYNAKEANYSAVVMISGAGGGVSGPSGIYPSLADKLAMTLRIPSIRLDYRKPAHTSYCTADTVAALDYLSEQFSTRHYVLIGWSFGGSPCFTVAASEPGRVAGVATIASQTAQTAGVRNLYPRPLLLLHGTGDTCLSPACSETLYHSYGGNTREVERHDIAGATTTDAPGATGNRKLHLFPGDDHGLSIHAVEAEKMLFRFVAEGLGFERLLKDDVITREADQDLVGSTQERINEMHQGHDLHNERL